VDVQLHDTILSQMLEEVSWPKSYSFIATFLTFWHYDDSAGFKYYCSTPTSRTSARLFLHCSQPACSTYHCIQDYQGSNEQAKGCRNQAEGCNREERKERREQDQDCRQHCKEEVMKKPPFVNGRCCWPILWMKEADPFCEWKIGFFCDVICSKTMCGSLHHVIFRSCRRVVWAL